MINRQRLSELFIKLTSFDSASFNEREICDYLKQKLANLGLHVFEDGAGNLIGGNSGNIYAKLQGNDSVSPILFSAHMDTVEPSIGKTALLSEDGIFTSNGETVLGADDCSGIAAVIEAIQTVIEKRLPHRTIEVIFSVAEEKYGLGMKHFDYSRLASNEAYVLDLAGKAGEAAYKAPTILYFQITVTGKSAHAGFAPETGVHAIAAAAEAVNALKMGKIDEETTLNIGTIRGGTATNIIADKCVVEGEIRSFSHQKALREFDNVLNIFARCAQKRSASLTEEHICHVKAYETDLSHSVVQRFKKACEKCGIAASLIPTLAGSDNNTLAQNNIAGIVLACPMDDCHTTKESASLDEMCLAAEITLELMTDLDSLV